MIEPRDAVLGRGINNIIKIIKYFVCTNGGLQFNANGDDMAACPNHDRIVAGQKRSNRAIQVSVPRGDFVEKDHARFHTSGAVADTPRIGAPICGIPGRKADAPAVAADGTLHLCQETMQVDNVGGASSLMEVVDIGRQKRGVIAALPVRDHRMRNVRLHRSKVRSSCIIKFVNGFEIAPPCLIIAYLFNAVVVPKTAGAAECGNTAISGYTSSSEDEDFWHLGLHYFRYQISRSAEDVGHPNMLRRSLISPCDLADCYRARQQSARVEQCLNCAKRMGRCSHPNALAFEYEQDPAVSIAVIEAQWRNGDVASYAEPNGI